VHDLVISVSEDRQTTQDSPGSRSDPLKNKRIRKWTNQPNNVCTKPRPLASFFTFYNKFIQTCHLIVDTW